MADEITCNLCGGTDFFKEAGHYYCSECQTQSQDIREHVFEVPEETTAVRSTSSKKIRSEKKSEDHLTSWECYNYIILGLVNELIELGANPRLKPTVRVLWFMYLNKLEVVNKNPDTLPKLGALNSLKDAQIIYGRPTKKRKSSRTPSPSTSADTSTLDTSTLRREKAKQRRSLVLAEYDEFSNTMQSEDLSLHNQSLTSLRSGSDTSKEDKTLRFNRSSRQELLKIMTKNHLKTHCTDVESALDCHKLSYSSLSSSFTHSCKVLSRNRIYAVIYLGLLIIKDNIQLGDMLRFIREGSLSYHHVEHFFPEELEGKNLNVKNWYKGHTMLSHYRMRLLTADIAVYLNVTKYIPRQNLAALCQRYCSELNLPDEVWGYALNLMSKSLPKLQLTAKSKIVPNYEGRTISMIMFVIKLMFGLDEVTEERFSAFAVNINMSPSREKNMFVWKDWSYFIMYRQLVLTQHHFPTQYIFDYDDIQNSNLSVDFLTEQNLKHEEEVRLTREGEVLQRLLSKLKSKGDDSSQKLQFLPTLTPFRDYIKELLASDVPEEKHYHIRVLQKDFKNDSFDFLVNPIFYLEETNTGRKIGIKHRGANDNLQMIKIPNTKIERESWRNAAKKMVFVELTSSFASDNDRKYCANHLEKSNKLAARIQVEKSKHYVRNFTQRHMKCYEKNVNHLIRTCKKHKKELQHELETSLGQTSQSNIMESPQIFTSSQENENAGDASHHVSQETQSQRSQEWDLHYIHYNPYERHWLKSMNVANISKEEFQEFIETFSESFKLLLNECARITQQHPKNLFEEFTDVEIYLCYVAEFCISDKSRDNVVNDDLKRLVNKAKANW